MELKNLESLSFMKELEENFMIKKEKMIIQINKDLIIIINKVI